MKSIKKIAATLLALATCASFIGCGGASLSSKNQGKANTLQISLFYGDYGRDWLDNLATAYESFNPGITVDVKTVVTYETIASQIEGGVYLSDLVISITNMTQAGSKGTFLELSDVLNSKATENESLTIKEKLGSAIEASNYEGNYYQIPWMLARTGLFYNKTSLDTLFPSGYELPVTTDGLISFCDDVRDANGWGFVFTNATNAEYAIYMRDTLSAQYMGYDAFNAYFDGEYYNTAGEKIFAENYDDLANAWHDAQLSALEVVETLYKNANGYSPTSCKTMDYMKAQAYFWGVTAQDDYKPTAFMVNGDWLYSGISYLSASKSADIRMMRMPINSEMINVLPSISTEEQLIECVKYVDSQIDGGSVARPAYLSDADYERLDEARRMVWGTHAQHSISIPKNCYNVDLAKDFIRFIASDEGGKIISKALNGLSSPFTPNIVDETATNNFSRSVVDSCKNAIYITGRPTKLTILGEHSYFRYLYFVQNLNTGKATASQILTEFTSNEKGKWADYKTAAGL